MGEACGVGPEVLLKALATGRPQRACRPLVLGDPEVLRATARRLGLGIGPIEVDAPEGVPPGGWGVLGCSRLGEVVPGRLTPEVARAAVRYVERAVELCERGIARAMVTCPLSKVALRWAGAPFPGHTELLAARTGAPRHAMMLVGGGLRVVLVTTHLPLREVPDSLSVRRILDVLELTQEALRGWFRVPLPRLAVAALNPHAGEEGLLGWEEQRVIAPAVRAARERGIEAEGPLAADTLFRRAERYDAVVCMYHDQALIPLKLLHFEEAVNLTLGLPFVRTSVGHGTAYDIAGQGVASPRSLLAAIELAAELCR